MNRTTGIILTVVTTLCCACPGLFSCLFGVMGLANVPITTTLGTDTSTQPMGAPLAIGLMCLSVILIAIPFAVGFFTLRNKPAAVPVQQNYNGPIPPAS